MAIFDKYYKIYIVVIDESDFDRYAYKGVNDNPDTSATERLKGLECEFEKMIKHGYDIKEGDKFHFDGMDEHEILPYEQPFEIIRKHYVVDEKKNTLTIWITVD